MIVDCCLFEKKKHNILYHLKFLLILIIIPYITIVTGTYVQSFNTYSYCIVYYDKS